MITVKLDVKKLDKTRFFVGEKGTWLDLVLIETPKSQYGDYMVKQGVSKEDREAGVEMPIIGNAKVVKKKAAATQQPQSGPQDDVPF